MPALEVKTFHSSGRWDRSRESLARNVRRMREGGRSLGTRTELTTEGHADELSWPDDGWGVYHPRSKWVDGFVDCAVEWDHSVWQLVDKQLVQLSETRIHTRGGFLLGPSTMPTVTLQHRTTQRHVVVGAFHMQLANTALRSKVWLEEADTIRRTTAEIRAEHPGWEFVWQGDCNRNQRLKVNRELVAEHMLAGTPLRNCWEGHLPKTGGTHGSRSILDLTVTSLSGGAHLLADDASSDHRPYATELSGT